MIPNAARLPPKSVMVIIRAEESKDREAVREVNASAFGRPGEADLVDALRENAPQHVSLIAEEDGRIVGHIFFSPVTVESGAGDWAAMGLAPMAILPEFQARGVGSRLVREGLEHCHRAGHDVVFVLGHADYYPRFGFTPAKPRGIECEFPAPDENFMVAELKPGALNGRAGMVRYRPEFRSV